MVTQEEYNRQRAQGRTIQSYGGYIQRREQSIRESEARIREKQKLGKDTTREEERIQRMKEAIGKYQGQLSGMREQLGEEEYRQSILNAPKNYRTGAQAPSYTVTTATGKKYVSSNREFLERKASQQQSMYLASTGQANYSDITGTPTKVTYERDTGSQLKTTSTGQIPYSGIVSVLEQKGLFRQAAIPGQTASYQIVAPKPFIQERPQYSSMYGYSTSEGRVEQFFSKKEIAEATPSLRGGLELSKKEFLQRQQGNLGKKLSAGPLFILDFGTRTAGVGAYKAGTFLQERGEKGNSQTLNVYLGRAGKGLGQSAFVNPRQQQVGVAVAYVGGAVIGKAGGFAVKKVGEKGGSIILSRLNVPSSTLSKAASRLQLGGGIALGGVTAGTVGYELATKTPEQIGSGAPSFVAGGVGFAKGYGSYIKPTNIEVTPYGKTTTKKSIMLSERDVSLSATQRATVRVTDLGQTVTYGRTIKINARTVPQQEVGTINYAVRSKVNIPFRGKTKTIVEETPAFYVAPEQGNIGLFTGYNPRTGVGFETTISPRISPVEIGGTVTEANILRTSIFKGDTIIKVSEGSTVRSGISYTKIPLQKGGGRVRVPSWGYELTAISGVAKGKTTSTSATMIDISSFRGARLLQERGLYRQSLGTRAYKRISAVKENIDTGFFNPRTTRLYSGLMLEKPQVRPTTFRPSKARLPEGRIKAPELFRVPFSTSTSTAPKYRFGYLAGGGIGAQSRLLYTGQAVTKQPGTINSFTPDSSIRFDTPQRTAPIQRTPQISSFSYGGTTIIPSKITPTPPRYTPPSTPPSFTPGVPGLVIPGFGLGRGSSPLKSGSGRTYRYVPSFTAIAFNIKGKRPGRLTGFEVRPILGSQKSRRRKKR